MNVIFFVVCSGLVLFLEEDHYVAEDFLHLLALMQRRANELCTKCNILSLGTYLKTFNYYTYANVNKVKLCALPRALLMGIQIDIFLLVCQTLKASVTFYLA